MNIFKDIFKRPLRWTVWYIAKRLCGIREGEHIGNSRLLPHIAILLNNDKWFWKLWLIKNRCGSEARNAFDNMCKDQFYDYNRQMWKVAHLTIPDELIATMTQADIDIAAAQVRKDNG